MKIWIDFTNTPHVNFFIPIIRHFEPHHEFVFTARDFSETVPLLKNNKIKHLLIGGHKGKSKLQKVIGLGQRISSLLFKVPEFDISISVGGQNTTPVSALRGKPSVVFTDNDTSYKYHSYRLGTYFIFPSYFKTNNLERKYGVKREQVFTYNGFKEDIYIADYVPDPNFLKQLPFTDFITIRPENLKASYVPTDAKTIVLELFEVFKNQNILYLPRYEYERAYAEGYKNIFIPNGPLPGLDVCYYTRAMLTGAGSFAREAAILGTPAVSFFPGIEFLTVDKVMQEKGWEFKSRNPQEIYNYVQHAIKKPDHISRSKNVQQALFKIIQNILDKYQK